MKEMNNKIPVDGKGKVKNAQRKQRKRRHDIDKECKQEGWKFCQKRKRDGKKLARIQSKRARQRDKKNEYNQKELTLSALKVWHLALSLNQKISAVHNIMRSHNQLAPN
jgi:hypothetical protein